MYRGNVICTYTARNSPSWSPSHIKGSVYTFCIVFGFNGSVADLSVRRFLLCACRFFVFASAPTARKWFWKYSSISESFLPWVSGSNSHTNTAAAIEIPAKNHCTAWDPIIKIKIEKIHLESDARVLRSNSRETST